MKKYIFKNLNYLFSYLFNFLLLWINLPLGLSNDIEDKHIFLLVMLQ
jgi:hypothetical protein